MADVSKINGYNVKDAKARQDVEKKQDKLVSGSNIKTVNGQSILGSGDISVVGGGDVDLSEYAKKSEIPDKVSQLTNDKNYASESYVSNAIANAQLGGGENNVDLSGYATKDELNDKADKTHSHSQYLTQHQDISHLATKEELNNIDVSEQLEHKQDKLISGINIKTINGISLLGDGDIEIKGNTTGGGDAQDILIGTLPQTITENFCYIISPTNATISTGEGVPNLLDFNEQVPYLKTATVTSAIPEVLGSSTLKIGSNANGKNLIVDIPKPDLTLGETYTMCFRVVDCTEDMVTAKVKPYIKWQGGTTFQISSSAISDRDWLFKSFTSEEAQDRIVTGCANNTTFTTDTNFTVEVRIYQGALTELPTGSTFDILAETQYSTDGYKGSTLSAVNGETVYLYQIDTSNAEVETDNGGVIFFGDSIMDFSNIPSLYAKRTGKPVIDCAVGGTRMSDSRDEGNAYKPYDMASIARAISNNDFTDVIEGGKNNGFTTLATSNVGGYKAVILEFGTNDYSAEVPFRGEGIDTIEGALKYVLNTFIEKYPNIRIVVLSTLQYITLGTGNESGVPVHPDGTVWEMNEVIKDVCESDEFCVPFIDMYHKFGQNAKTRNYLNADGVHLTSPNGVQRYLDILVGQLNSLGI